MVYSGSSFLTSSVVAAASTFSSVSSTSTFFPSPALLSPALALSLVLLRDPKLQLLFLELSERLPNMPVTILENRPLLADDWLSKSLSPSTANFPLLAFEPIEPPPKNGFFFDEKLIVCLG